MAWLEDWSLLDPWFLGLIPVAWIVLLWRLRRPRAALPTASSAMLQGLPRSLRVRLVYLPAIVTAVALSILALALARPVTREVLPIREQGVDILLLVDISSSMDATDMEQGTQLRRVEAARAKAMEFASGRGHDRLGLMTFALYPELRCPITLDTDALAAFLRGVETVQRGGPEDQTGIGVALAQAVSFLESSDAASKVVVLLTDGQDNVPDVTPEEAAKLAADAGIRVHTIGLGDGMVFRDPFGRVHRQPSDFSAIEQIAEATGGSFFAARDAEGLGEVYAAIDEMETVELEDPRYRTSDWFGGPLLVGIALLLLAFLLDSLWIRGESMNELHWNRPELWPWLLLLPVVWVLIWQALRVGRRGCAVYGAPLRERVPSAGGLATLWSTAAALLFLAWMEPLLGEEKVAVERRGLDVIFCLDTSRSMLARDLEPDRLGRAVRDIQTVLPHLVGGDRVALIAFAGKTRLVVPLTHDLDSFRYLLARVDTDTVRTGGTDLAAAIRRGLEVSSEDDANTTAIVLLTDGEDLTGAGRQAAGEAAARGVVVHAIGYGSTRGSKIILDDRGEEAFLTSDEGDEVITVMNSEGLRRLAEVTGGEFVRADVMPLPLVELKEKRIDPIVKRAYDAGEETLYKTRYQWALLPAVVLLLFGLLRQGGRRQ